MSEFSKPNNKSINTKLAALLLGVGAAINPLNSSLIVTSFADIASEYEVSFASVSSMMAFYLAFTVAFYPIAGAVGDRLGRKRVFMFGVVGFGIVSLIASTATSFNMLLVCRCLQALFSAALMPNATAILGDMVPKEKLATSMGLMGAVVGLSAAVGFPLGGFIAESYGWRPLFWINGPLALLAGIAVWRLIPKDRIIATRFSLIAFFGVPLLPMALGVNFLLKPDVHGVLIPQVLIAVSFLCMFAIALSLYRSISLRREVVQFSSKGFWFATLTGVFSNVVLYSIFLALPTWFMYGLGVERGTAGLYLGLIILALAFGSPLSGRLVDRFNEKSVLILATLFLAVALSLFWQMDEYSMAVIILAAILLGVGFAGIFNAGQTLALKKVPGDASSMAMGLHTSGRYLGGLVGTTSVAYILISKPYIDLVTGKQIFEAMFILAVIPLILVCLILPTDSAAKKES